MLKKLLIVFVLSFGVVTALSLAPIKFEPVGKTSASNGDGCPDGSYNIGGKDEVICKLEPTGCPFGDSVPMDKCTPPPDITCNADWSKCEPKKESESSNGASKPSNSGSTPSKEEYPASGYCGK